MPHHHELNLLGSSPCTASPRPSCRSSLLDLELIGHGHVELLVEVLDLELTRLHHVELLDLELTASATSSSWSSSSTSSSPPWPPWNCGLALSHFT
jgi:hypothetical protein